jgi:phosphoglycerate dehydrogenase-like enzyme
MSANPLTIWCNPLISDDARALLIEGAKPHRLIFSPQPSYNLVAGPADEMFDQADVAFGQPDPESAMRATKLRWIHLTSAGYARYDTPEFRKAIAARGAIVTNSSQVYADPCAEHLLAFMLANARQLLPAHRVQLTERSWPTEPLRVTSRLLLGQRALILGYGAIARRLIELLAPFRMNVTALRREIGNEVVPVVTEDQFVRAVVDVDHVINTLPEGTATTNFVRAEHFAAMKPGAVFYNVGRGTTVDQPALQAALQSGHLAAAYLDVTDPEPLPPEHPLWTTRGCFVTPHSGGGHEDEHERFVQHFLVNLNRYVTSEPLLDRLM